MNYQRYRAEIKGLLRQTLDISIEEAKLRILNFLKEHRGPQPYAHVIEQTELTEQKNVFLRDLRKALRASKGKIIWKDETLEFVPMYRVANKDDLRKLLSDFSREGYGAIDLEELKDSYEGVEDDVAHLEEEGFLFKLPKKERGFLLYHKQMQDEQGFKFDYKIKRELRERWRRVDMKAMTEERIKEVLIEAGEQPVHVFDDTRKPEEPRQKGKRRNKKDRAQTKEFLQRFIAQSEMSAKKEKK